MEEILREILKRTNSDRVILYQIEPNNLFASQKSLYHLRPQLIVSTDLGDSYESSQTLYKKSYPYHIFSDAIQTLFDELSFSFIPGIDNRLSKSCSLGLENLCLELNLKSINYFLINEKYLLSIHNCKRPSLIKRSHLLNRLNVIKELL